jgi:inosine/xanthosine triphosphate pyrophosphatase family protein/dephospho-CoA kinase
MRIDPREPFLEGERQLEVYFYTSNETKFLQARFVFARAGLTLRYFPSSTDPYEEGYDVDKNVLLQRAVRQVASTTTEQALFFVEDTSLRIEAISSVGVDVPGLAVKEWFANTSFEELDRQLRTLGVDRSAVIKSDIALHLPGRANPLLFHGQTAGRVADQPMTGPGQEGYPWLGTDSFNAWFIPEGMDRCLSEMDLETSLEYDFRVRALTSLLDRLEEYASVLNLPPVAYKRRPRFVAGVQPSLFRSRAPLLVLGRTCAGKTTFANYAFQAHGLQHVEASSVVRMSHQHSVPNGQGALAAAQDLLSDYGPGYVAQQILRLFPVGDQGLVLTGFRTIEEVLTFCRHYEDTVVLWIDALERTRYERHVHRGRYQEASSLASFRELDEGQMSLGLLRNGKDLADFVFENEEPIEEYYRRIRSILSGTNYQDVPGLTRLPVFSVRRTRDQLYRILKALVGKPSMTSREISGLTEDRGRRIATRNVNDVLKRFPELAQRFEPPGQEIRYQATPSGNAYVELMDLRSDEPKREFPFAPALSDTAALSAKS